MNEMHRNIAHGSRQHHTQRDGYILLLSVLIVGAVGTAIATSILMLSIGNNLNSLASQQADQALSIATACAEDTLEQLRIDPTYAGNTTLSFDDGDCVVNPVISTEGVHIVQVTGTVGTIVHKLEITIQDIGPPTVITSWRDVDEFAQI
jgi:hypothetical protein